MLDTWRVALRFPLYHFLNTKVVQASIAQDYAFQGSCRNIFWSMGFKEQLLQHLRQVPGIGGKVVTLQGTE